MADGSGVQAFGEAGRSLPYDPSKPSIARVYDYWLDGKDNFAVDRDFATRLEQVLPNVRVIVRANRDFLGKAVRYLVSDCGISQFLDIGAGLPTVENVHQVAQACDPSARVVYVDNDPEVLTHARALLAEDGQTGVVTCDLRRPSLIWSDPVVNDILDRDAPIGLIMVSVLHFIGDQDEPHRLVREYLDALPSGSFLVLTHARVNPAGEAIEGLYHNDLAERGGGGATSRTEEQILQFFEGLEIVGPGLVPVTQWSAEGRTDSGDVPFLGALGRKL